MRRESAYHPRCCHMVTTTTTTYRTISSVCILTLTIFILFILRCCCCCCCHKATTTKYNILNRCSLSLSLITATTITDIRSPVKYIREERTSTIILLSLYLFFPYLTFIIITCAGAVVVVVSNNANKLGASLFLAFVAVP